jgi:predicted metal-binding membrane protein
MSATAVVDTPRLAYRALERRATFLTAGALLVLAAGAWWLTVRRADDMSGMVSGLAQVGGAMSFDMAAPVFLAMWVTMMVAMMFPTIAPIVLLHRMVIRRRGGGVTATVWFVAGYLLVWTVTGIAPLAALLAFRDLTADSMSIARACGVVLLVAGAYQFTPWKQACLRACRTPLTFLSTHDFGHGLRGTLRAGISNGVYCLGCCWALMAVLFAVGLMNLAWMAAIAVVFLAEKNWRYGVALTRTVGIATALFGLVVLVYPEVLDRMATTAVMPAMSM